MDSLKLTTTEKLIVENRLTGDSLSETYGNDRRHFLDQVVARISAQVGCDLPQTDFFANIVCEEMEGIMVDFGYDQLTLKEVVFAIRMNSSPSSMKLPSGVDLDHVPFSGRLPNGYFLSKVLSNYMMFRKILDGKFTNFIDGYK